MDPNVLWSDTSRAEVTSVDQRGVVFDIGAGKKAFIEASDVVDFVTVDASGDGTTSKKVDLYFLMKQVRSLANPFYFIS